MVKLNKIIYLRINVDFKIILRVSMLIFSTIHSVLDSSPDRVKPKTMQLVFVASPVSTQHKGEIAMTG
jgi:hypothetical protein